MPCSRERFISVISLFHAPESLFSHSPQPRPPTGLHLHTRAALQSGLALATLHWRFCSHVVSGPSTYFTHDKHLSIIFCFCCLFLPRFHCTLSYPQPKKPRSASADVCKLIKRRPTQGYVCTHHPPQESTLQRQRIRPLSYFWHWIS